MRKLEIELIPDGCFKSNLRNILSKKQWDFIKQDAKMRSNNKCSICGKSSCRLDAHERWSYDIKNGIQKLEDVIAVCSDCHGAIHMNRSQLFANAEKIENHYIKVNGCTYSEMRADMGRANQLQQERNKVAEWKLDITWLKRFTGEA